MDRKIIVAGAGHGGIVAAYYLALEGYDVTVYEKGKKGKLGLKQTDSVHLDGFELSGIPVPEDYKVVRTPITFCVPGTDIEPISQVQSDDSYTVEIDRNALYKHLISLAEDAGAKFVYNCEITEPLILGGRVVGIKTNKGDIYADMVIDACGLYSPLRMNLPDFMNITKMPGMHDILHTYRAYFNRLKSAEEPKFKYEVSLIPGDDCGLMWVITHEKTVDVFLGFFKGIDEEKIENCLEILRKDNPHIGQRLLKGGNVVDIPVRQPLAIMVADGYAAVGDSAFMTIPVKGSGIGYAMRAGKLLADCIASDTDGIYDKETLWEYQSKFFEDIGFGACMLAVVKGLFPMLTMDDLEYALGGKLISSEDFSMFGSEAGLGKIITSLKASVIMDKAKKIVGFPDLRKLISTAAKNVAKMKVVESRYKDVYTPENAEKWAKLYNSFFENVSEGERE